MGKRSPRPEPYGMSMFISLGNEMRKNQQRGLRRSSREVEGGKSSESCVLKARQGKFQGRHSDQVLIS